MQNVVVSLAQKRYSVRKYDSCPLPDELLRYVIEAARLAPSAVNLQPATYIVVRDAALLARLAEAYDADLSACELVALLPPAYTAETVHEAYKFADDVFHDTLVAVVLDAGNGDTAAAGLDDVDVAAFRIVKRAAHADVAYVGACIQNSAADWCAERYEKALGVANAAYHLRLFGREIVVYGHLLSQCRERGNRFVV